MPTYTVLKAITAVILARKLEAHTGRPVIPVFWLGSEDHDLVEMASTWVPGRSGAVHSPLAGRANDGFVRPPNRHLLGHVEWACIAAGLEAQG